MEFTKLIALLESPIREDIYIALEYLKSQYPGEIPRGIRSLLYGDVPSEIGDLYYNMSYKDDIRTFPCWKISWKD